MDRKHFFTAFLFFITSALSFSQPATNTRNICSALSAVKISENAIKLTWTTPINFKAASIAIFRDTKQITQDTIFSSMKPIAELPAKSTSYLDQVEYYNDYYYAISARNADGSLYNLIVPSANATVTPVKITNSKRNDYEYKEEEKLYFAGQLRELPLPYLDIIEDLIISPTKLPPAAKNEAEILAGEFSKPHPKILPPYIFEDDLVQTQTGDDYFLFEVLKTTFIKQDYKNAVIELKKFLSANRDDYTMIRAAFYLAEAQYYCKKYRHALTLFLFVEDELPELTRKWIDSTLDLYKIPESSFLSFESIQ